MKRTKRATPKRKKCRTCGKTMAVKTKKGTNFWKNAKSPDGLRDECKACFYEWRRARNAEQKAG